MSAAENDAVPPKTSGEVVDLLAALQKSVTAARIAHRETRWEIATGKCLTCESWGRRHCGEHSDTPIPPVASDGGVAS